jgi:hypothetical protein
MAIGTAAKSYPNTAGPEVRPRCRLSATKAAGLGKLSHENLLRT